MRKWKVKDAQWKVCDWTISICLAQRDKALQTVSHEALITYYSRKYDLCVSLCCVILLRFVKEMFQGYLKVTQSCDHDRDRSQLY